MNFTETEVVEVRLCAHSERNDINTKHLVTVSLKTKKKKIENSTSNRSRSCVSGIADESTS